MLQIKADARDLKRAFRKLQARQIPFATANALNIIGEGVRTDLVDEMKRVFQGPTAFTLRAFYVVKAGPRRLQVFIGIRDFAAKGTPAWKYLTPQVDGGARRMKRLELRLSALAGGQFVLPGRGAKLDSYGNISRGQIQQVLSRLGAMNDPQQNMTDKTAQRLRRKGLIAKGAKSDYFIAKAKNGSGRPLGVYQLVGPGKVEPVLVFTPKAPTYRKRFDPAGIVLQGVNRYGAKAIREAIAHELATSK